MERIELTGEYVRTVFDSKAKGRTAEGAPVWRIIRFVTTDIDLLPESIRRENAERGVAEISISGTDLPVTPNMKYSMIGYFEYKKGDRNPWMFKALSYSLYDTHSASQAHAFLSSCDESVVSGAVAVRCVAMFGGSFFDVLTRAPDELLSVEGMSIESRDKIVEHYHNIFSLHELQRIMMPLDVSTEKVHSILQHRGNKVLEEVKKDPFCLYGNKGLSFSQCMKLCNSLNLSGNLKSIISCALHQELRSAHNLGHLFLTESVLVDAVKKTTKQADVVATSEQITTILNQLVQIGKFVRRDGNAIYLAESDAAETMLAAKIASICKHFQAQPRIEQRAIDAALEAAIQTLAFTPEEKQVAAVRLCLESGVSVITGGPGTGKSTVLDLVIKAYKHLFADKQIALMAPSGKAARRMSECTNMPATTVHKYLGCNGDIDETSVHQQFAHGGAELIIIDESSMLDLFVANALFSSLPDSTQVIFVGDVNQLPSVGPGNVLRSIIECGCVGTTELNMVHRQSGQSLIVTNAHRINNGEKDMVWGEDFRMFAADTAAETRQMVMDIYAEVVNEVGIDNVAILTPYRTKKREISSSSIIPDLQNRVNPRKENEPYVRSMGREFRVNDRIMQMKNKGDISNGDIGVIKAVVPVDPNNGVFEDYIIAEFNGVEQRIAGEGLEHIESALCYTIHKSQGSEYKVVIIPLFEDVSRENGENNCKNSDFISRNLVYTAVTRAKERVIFVGRSAVLECAIKENAVKPRNSQLDKRIVEMLEKKEAQDTMDKDRLIKLQSEFGELLCANVKRDGLEPLYEWLVKSDFFFAPYGEKGPFAYEGGLLEHSILTYRYLQTANMQLKKPYPEDTIAIVGLLHDICLANTFKTETRNRKKEDGDWEKVPYYIKSDRFPAGHGEKSVIILQMFLKGEVSEDAEGNKVTKSALSSEEIVAIRWHEGFNDPAVKYGEVSLNDIYAHSKLAYLLVRANQDANVLRNLM